MKKWVYVVIATVIGVVGWAAYNIYKHSYDPELQKQKESIKAQADIFREMDVVTKIDSCGKDCIEISLDMKNFLMAMQMEDLKVRKQLANAGFKRVRFKYGESKVVKEYWINPECLNEDYKGEIIISK